MPNKNRTFRLFVSSTFADLAAERNVLQEKTFPRLREYCREKGASFQAIDLHWGRSKESDFPSLAFASSLSHHIPLAL